MDFRFFCPACGLKLKADVEALGVTVDCPDGQTGFRAPHPGP
jgi:hypothetical protein